MSQITTHILDTATGAPANGVAITLCRRDGDSWAPMGSGTTDADGRIADLCSDGTPLSAGTYRMVFAIGEYFASRKQANFYPWAEVIFSIEGDGQHYHIPLLLSPYGYSTYRGS